MVRKLLVLNTQVAEAFVGDKRLVLIFCYIVLSNIIFITPEIRDVIIFILAQYM